MSNNTKVKPSRKADHEDHEARTQVDKTGSVETRTLTSYSSTEMGMKWGPVHQLLQGRNDEVRGDRW